MTEADGAAPPEPPFIRAYDAMLRAVDHVVGLFVTVVMAVLAAVVLISVFFRYVLNQSLQWGWDIPRLSFIWVILLSIPLAFRYSAHVGMDFDLTRLKFVSRKMINRFNAVFMLVLFALTAFYGSQLMRSTWDQGMPGVDLSVGLFYLGLLVGQVHCCLHVLRILITGETLKEPLADI